jgi:hypothetical protein
MARAAMPTSKSIKKPVVKTLLITEHTLAYATVAAEIFGKDLNIMMIPTFSR